MNKLRKLKQGLTAISQFLLKQEKMKLGLYMMSLEGNYITTIGNKFIDSRKIIKSN